MFLRMAGRRVVIVGGGEQAAQKARLMIRTEAALTVIAPSVDPEIGALIAAGRLTQHTGPLAPDLFANTALVFIGTGCPAYDACAHALAKVAGALVNVVDQPALCDATTPSIVDRDPVVVAIGTEGTAPVLGRAIKTRIETILDPRLGDYAALAGRLRKAVAGRIPKQRRRAFWAWAFQDAPWAAFRRGADRQAATLLKSAIDGGGGGAKAGSLTILSGADAEADLMTLRAVARLQEADTIYYSVDINPEILDLARRDAQRVEMRGLETLPPASAEYWLPIVQSARGGAHLVWLLSGRNERAQDLFSHHSVGLKGISVECVP